MRRDCGWWEGSWGVEERGWRVLLDTKQNRKWKIIKQSRWKTSFKNELLQNGTDFFSGKGNGFLTSLLFSSLKSVRKRTVPFFFGWMKDGAAHSDDNCHSNTPNSMRRLISFIMVSLWTFGIGNAQPWYFLAPSLNSKDTGVVFQAPRIPSKSGSKSVSNVCHMFFSTELRCCNCLLLLGGLPFYNLHLKFAVRVEYLALCLEAPLKQSSCCWGPVLNF